MNGSDVTSDQLVSAAKEIFGTMVFLDIEPGPPGRLHLVRDAVLGLITFKGDEMEGCFGICCDRDAAKAIALGMLGLDSNASLTNQEINDAVGEITNMIMGILKASNAGLGKVRVSIPTVVNGREIEHNLGERAYESYVAVLVGNQYLAELSVLWKAGPRRSLEN